MLSKIFPRIHARFLALRVLGPHLEGFVVWLLLQGYPLLPIRLRVRAAEQLDSLLWKLRPRVARSVMTVLVMWSRIAHSGLSLASRRPYFT